MRNGILTAFIALVFSSFIAGCDSTNDPSGDEIDPALIGVWYRVDSLSMDHPAPDVEVSGIRITAGKDYNELGVETTSGKLAVLATSRVKELVSARNGVLIRKYYASLAGLVDQTFSYQVRGDTLTIISADGKQSKVVYVRTVIGSQVAEPIDTRFTVTIGNDLIGPYNALEVYPFPAAYASRVSPSELKIVAVLIEQSTVALDIDDFHGPGHYQISSGFPEPVVQRFGDDHVSAYFSSPALHSSITIDRYDEEANICSGTFSATLTGDPLGGDGRGHLELKEGSFSVPIYK